MKRLLPLSLLALTAGLKAMAVTLSGTVYYRSAPSIGDAYVPVTISDTLGTWSTTVYTDFYGQYSVSIPSSVATTAPGNQINVSVSECGVWQRQIVINSGSPVANFNICAASAPISGLHGTVSLGAGTTPNTGQAKLWLIRKAYDATLMDTVLTPIDSFLTAATGGAYNQAYTVKPGGNLILKAALLPGHPQYANYLPTYALGGLSSLMNSSAMPIHTSWWTGPALNIGLQAGTNPGGPGFISGQVSLGANKTAGVGDPLNGREITILSNDGQVAARAVSDASGKFSFPSLPYGTYRLFGDQFRKSNPELSITLSATNPRITNILFEENDTKFAGKLINVGVHETRNTTLLEGVSAYPNPATNIVKVTGLEAIKGQKTIILQSMTGAEISRQSLLNGDAVVETAALPAGIYTILVQTEQGKASLKITK